MPRVLITGAAGFIGMHTSIRFLREGWDVIGLDNMNDYYSVALKRNRLAEIVNTANKLDKTFEILEADLNSDVWGKFENIEFEAVVHLAAQAGVRYSIENPRAYLESNIIGFQSVLEFVSKKGIERFLYASSSSVYGKNSSQPFSEKAPCDSPESYYASTKRANELMAKSLFHTEGLSSIGLRFFTVYGPWGRPDMFFYKILNSAKNKKTFSVYDYGNHNRDFTYIDDVITIMIKILNYKSNTQVPYRLLNIGEGKPIKLKKIIKLIEKIYGSKIKIKFFPRQLGDVKTTFAASTRIKKLANFFNFTDLSEGIKSYITWFNKYY